jgi:hypothetical protein
MLRPDHEHEDQNRVVEMLVRESNAPFAEVARLYELERAKLEIGAHIKHFLPIFAIRNVREILGRRRFKSHSALAAAGTAADFR